MPRPHGPDLRRLDVAEFARAGAQASGETPVSAMRRLHESTLPAGRAPASVAWRVEGERASLGSAGRQPLLHVVAETTLPLECQRCLQAVEVPLQVDRRIFFVEGEDAAAALDADSDDDVLALSRAFDVPALIEDELLLALPIVPRHTACPQPLVVPGAAAAEAPGGDAAASDATAAPAHPFAMLASLKRGKLPN